MSAVLFFYICYQGIATCYWINQGQFVDMHRCESVIKQLNLDSKHARCIDIR